MSGVWTVNCLVLRFNRLLEQSMNPSKLPTDVNKLNNLKPEKISRRPLKEPFYHRFR